MRGVAPYGSGGPVDTVSASCLLVVVVADACAWQCQPCPSRPHEIAQRLGSPCPARATQALPTGRSSCVFRPESGNLYVERQTKRNGMTASNWSTSGLLKNYWSTYPEDSSLTRDTYVLGYKMLTIFGAKLSGG